MLTGSCMELSFSLLCVRARTGRKTFQSIHAHERKGKTPGQLKRMFIAAEFSIAVQTRIEGALTTLRRERASALPVSPFARE